MNKAHVNQNWKNKPSLETPINETNLNRLDRSVDVIDDRVVLFDTSKANQTDLLQTVKTITFNRSTGVFTVTKFNGSSFDIDTDLEKIAINFDYDDDPTSVHYQQLILTLIDGTVKYIDLSALITQFEFVDSAQIHFSVNQNGEVSATIIKGSITEDMLEPNFLANCKLEVSKAEDFADESESWATGKRNGTDVPSTDPAYNNNALHYAGIASTKASEASNSAASAASSESNASTSATNAINSANNAAISESNALSYKNSATDSAIAASNSATTANSSERRATSSADSALESETKAKNYAERAEEAEEAVESAISGLRPVARGEWDADKQYYMLDLVRYGSSTWLARRENINVIPTEGEDWQWFAASIQIQVVNNRLVIGS